MTGIAQSTVSEAHRLVGFLKGLQDGLHHWRADAVTGDMIERLRQALGEAYGKADHVASTLSEFSALQREADLCAKVDDIRKLVRGAA